MSLSNSEISLYVDTMIVQAFLDEGLVKQGAEGSFIMPLISKVKEYVSGHIDQNNKVDSVINFLAPGAVTLLLKSMGFGWIGTLMGLLMSVAHVDVASILEKIYSTVKGLLSTGKPITSAQIDAATKDAAQTHSPDSGSADDAQTFASRMRDVRLLKLAMIQYRSTGNINKNAQLASMIGPKAIGIFTTIIGWIFKTVLASAGLMAAGDVANKLVGRSNALDGTLHGSKPAGGGLWEGFMGGGKSETPVAQTVVSTQTKFPKNKSYADTQNNSSGVNWAEHVTNNKPAIESMLISFAKEVYSGLDNLDSVIRSSKIFQTIVDQIVYYNHTNPDDPTVYIPRQFTSKKQIVDYFIDDVAAKAP